MSLDIAGTNKFVDVNFISSLRSIECTFLDNPLDGVTTCSANLTYGANCDIPLGVYSSSGPTNLLRTTAINFISDISDYCFTINASSASETVIIEGTLNVINLGKGILNDTLCSELLYNKLRICGHCTNCCSICIGNHHLWSTGFDVCTNPVVSV